MIPKGVGVQLANPKFGTNLFIKKYLFGRKCFFWPILDFGAQTPVRTKIDFNIYLFEVLNLLTFSISSESLAQ